MEKKLFILISGIFMLNGQQVYTVAIIGSGPAALSAAVCTARAGLKPVVIEGKEPGGQSKKAGTITNWPGISAIEGGELIENIKKHATEHGSTFLTHEVTKVDFDKKPFSLTLDDDRVIEAHSVIIATGSQPTKLNVPGEKEYLSKGVAVCATCDAPLFKNKEVVVIGSNHSALREIGILKKYTSSITLINPEKELSGPKMLQNYVTEKPAVTVINNTEVIEIVGNGKRATGVKVRNKTTKQESTITTSGVFVALGWQPTSSLFESALKLNDKKQIEVTDNTRTSVDGVYAAGDVSSNSYHQLFPAAGLGYIAGLEAEKYLKKEGILT